ncbi:MAG: hypothetical protein WCS88_03855 [Patescibacteria group bacterium]|jgi:hypothetical protein
MTTTRSQTIGMDAAEIDSLVSTLRRCLAEAHASENKLRAQVAAKDVEIRRLEAEALSVIPRRAR